MARNDKPAADGEAVETETANETANETTELDELRAENERLRAELDAARAAEPRPMFTTDVDLTEQRRRQAERERAVMERSEGARLDREQQDNVAAAAARPAVPADE